MTNCKHCTVTEETTGDKIGTHITLCDECANKCVAPIRTCHVCHSPTQKTECNYPRFWFDACTNRSCDWRLPITHYNLNNGFIGLDGKRLRSDYSEGSDYRINESAYDPIRDEQEEAHRAAQESYFDLSYC